MKKVIRRSISRLTLRVFSGSSYKGNVDNQKGGWLFQRRQESTLTQSDPSMDDGFNVAAFYVEGQLDFPNQVPGNVLQLYHELYDMEQKVKELENEIAVYVMSFQNKSHQPAVRKGFVPMRSKPNAQRNCCIPGLWNCARPVPVINDTTRQRNRTFPNARNPKKRTSVSTAVQTLNVDNRSSRLSKVSWNSKVDVRYIGSGIQSGNAQKAPLQEAESQPKVNEEMKNVVHLKIKIPKDVLNLRSDDGGRQASWRLENEWEAFNSEIREEEKISIIGQNKKDDQMGEKSGDLNLIHTSSNRNANEPSMPLRSDMDTVNVAQMKQDVPRKSENTIVGTSIVRNDKDENTQMVGIPVKEPGKPVCESQGCTCKGSTRNDNNMEKVRQSFDMTESELSLLEEAVHNDNPGPVEMKIQTEYGSVNVISHDPDCKCKVCETFGSHEKSPHKRSGRSDSAAVISKKIIRVNYNGHYRNIITHTEECGCDICSNIEEHSYKLMRKRASIVSTHQGELVIKNKGVCGCENCKTIEMGQHVLEVETLLSRTSCHELDQCYYSDATLPSMQSFPRECFTTTDDQGTSFSGPPSINSSDLSSDDVIHGLISNVNKYDRVDKVSKGRQQLYHNPEVSNDTSKGMCSECEKTVTVRSKRARDRIYNFVKPSSAKYVHDKSKKNNKCKQCTPCKNTTESVKDKFRTAPIITRSSSHEKPVERGTLVDTGDTIQANKSDVDKKAEQVPSFKSDNITLEDLIKDLIRGQPGNKKDKVYTVTLGEIANKAYTKIHVVECSGNVNDVNKNKINTNKVIKNPVTWRSGDGSDSNVFFIKALPSSVQVSQDQTSALSDSDDNRPSSKNRSVSSPACIKVDSIQTHPKQCVSPQAAEKISKSNQDNPDVKMISRSASETSPRSDVHRKAYKLTISFGRKVASFFKQRGRKSGMPNRADTQNLNENPKCLKAFTIYEEPESLKHMELLQIDMKPRYFTLATHKEGNAASTLRQGPILCLVEKNSATQVLAAVAR